jgi:hypothetical protein
MIQPGSSVYKKFEIVSTQVKKQLEKKGMVIPFENDDGSISIGNYIVLKQDGFYLIMNFAKEIIADKINLPQTAAILANKLALGKFLDKQLLKTDQDYGYAEFEENLYNKLILKDKKHLDNTNILLTKVKLKQQKKETARREILQQFEKLRKFA